MTRASVKKLLFLGVPLLIVGLSIISVLLMFPHSETIYYLTIDLTTTGSYFSEKIRMERGYLLDLDITSSEASTLYIVGQMVGEIFKVDGSTYKYSIIISRGDVQQVQVYNKGGHYDWGFLWVTHENHITGNLYLKRNPSYFYQLMYTGIIMLVVGLVMVPTAIYVEYRETQRKKLLYECPSCGKEVMTGQKTCPYCKIDLTKHWIRCKYCNKLYDSHYEKCPSCGAETKR